MTVLCGEKIWNPWKRQYWFERIEALEKSNEEKDRQIESIFENLQHVYQKTGLVKYDAFREMSGKLSYAVALLDKEDNGILVNSMYSRDRNV